MTNLGREIFQYELAQVVVSNVHLEQAAANGEKVRLSAVEENSSPRCTLKAAQRVITDLCRDSEPQLNWP